MWKSKLSEIAKLKDLFGESLNEGIKESDIILFEKAVKDQLNVDVPDSYLEILKIINGLEFNGFIIYGIDSDILNVNIKINGFIDNNKTWYENEWQKKYLFIGDSDISWYAYDLTSLKYCELSKPSGDLLKVYDDIDTILDKLLGDAIN